MGQAGHSAHASRTVGGAGAGPGSCRPGNCESRAPGVHSRGQGSMCIRIRAAVNSGRTQIKAGPRILIPERGSWRPALRNAAALAVESARGGGSPVVCRAINVRIRARHGNSAPKHARASGKPCSRLGDTAAPRICGEGGYFQQPTQEHRSRHAAAARGPPVGHGRDIDRVMAID